jgi:hypothetical protein
VNSDQVETAQAMQQQTAAPDDDRPVATDAETVMDAMHTDEQDTADARTTPTGTVGPAEDQDIGHEHFVPRGTLLFLLIMLVGYALYWAYLWFIVVVEHGGGV